MKGNASVLSTARRSSCGWVQLWPDGPKFAEFNVGSISSSYLSARHGYDESVVGGYYAWGGCVNHSHECINGTDTSLRGGSDVATYLWGTNWRMPTKEELKSLVDGSKTVVRWVDTGYGRLHGLRISGLGAYSCYSIFLPAAGQFNGFHDGDDSYGLYWSSTPDGSYDSHFLGFNKGTINDNG